MKNTRNRSVRYYFHFYIFIITMVAIMGCTAGKQPIRSDLTMSHLPSYKEGTTYVYSDGTWETVTAVMPDMVSWIDHRGKVSSGSPDFMFKRSNWKTKTRGGTREFKTHKGFFFDDAATLWPLSKGNSLNFSEIGSWSKKAGPKKSYRKEWYCKVVGTERVSVMAGEFDTWKILCNRFSRGNHRLREVKIWYYSPEVGHYVLNITKYRYNKSPRRLELLSVLSPMAELPVKAKRHMDRSFQDALELNKQNVPVSWSFAAMNISGETTPGKAFKQPDGTFCRHYSQKVKLVDSIHSNYGMACRVSKGNWIIPRLKRI